LILPKVERNSTSFNGYREFVAKQARQVVMMALRAASICFSKALRSPLAASPFPRAFETPPQSLPVKHFSGQRHYCYGVTATESVLIRNARERVTRMADAPELNYSDFSVRKATHYVKIDLGGKGAPAAMTGIFLPENYRIPDQVDMVLWLMGHHDNPEYPPSLTIDDYWTNYAHFRFRQFVNGSNKNVVLVAPTLGPHSDSGDLTKSGGLGTYLDQVLAALNKHAGFPDVPTLGDLVIACHSGGGSPMLKIASTNQKYSGNIKQLWGFDCLYGDGVEAAWMTWAQQNGSKILFIRYGSSTPDRSQTLKRLAAKQSNINVDGDASTPHNRVPVTYFHNFLRQARFFLDK
jgi:hypothetical protein